MTLYQWKSLAAFARTYLNRPRLTVRTLQRWNRFRLRIPVAKSFASQQGRVAISEKMFRKWLDLVFLVQRKR